MKIKIQTETGIRGYDVKESNLYKYAKRKRKGETVYVRKIKILDEVTNKKSYKPVVQRSKYIYDVNRAAYTKFIPGKVMIIKTREGEKVATHEEVRHTYRRRQGYYEKKAMSARYKVKRKGEIKQGEQIIVRQKISIDGRKQYIIGYSHVSTGKQSKDELLKQAKSNMSAQLVYAREQFKSVKTVGSIRVEVQRYVR